ncbi:S26 family signal peptidase [Streptomyces sp. NPDC001315]|uniref:S26 family signal peptidase n=1 Tax=Streptomyces sp. NPDC001315 TaxID=3364562 RepID=UPI0036B6C69B
MSAVLCALGGLSLVLLLVLALGWIRRRMVVITVKGVSMRPTLGAGDVLIGHRVRTSRLRSGQIVVLQKPNPGADWATWTWPEQPGHFMIKRLAAVPGDPVPVAARARLGRGPVPPGSVVVLGDNLQESVDSREIGYVPLERVVGVALRTYRRSPHDTCR